MTELFGQNKCICFLQGFTDVPRKVGTSLTFCGNIHHKKPCPAREAISSEERLVMILRYLASGDSQPLALGAAEVRFAKS